MFARFSRCVLALIEYCKAEPLARRYSTWPMTIHWWRTTIPTTSWHSGIEDERAHSRRRTCTMSKIIDLFRDSSSSRRSAVTARTLSGEFERFWVGLSVYYVCARLMVRLAEYEMMFLFFLCERPSTDNVCVEGDVFMLLDPTFSVHTNSLRRGTKTKTMIIGRGPIPYTSWKQARYGLTWCNSRNPNPYPRRNIIYSLILTPVMENLLRNR